MNKADAAAFLGVSVRTLEGYATAGRIGSTYVKGKTRQIADFAEADLERLKTELETPVARAFPLAVESRETTLARFNEAPQGNSGGHLLVVTPEALMSFAAELRSNTQNHVETPFSDRAFLSVDESAAYLGVSVGAIKKAIKSGAITVKQGLARGHRIKRTELEAWGETL